MQAIIEANTEATDYTNDDGTWDQSAIMSRGHELAANMDSGRDYADRLSEGMTKAWAEAKDESSAETKALTAAPALKIHTKASDWQSNTEADETETSPSHVEGRHTTRYDPNRETVYFDFFNADLPEDACWRIHEDCMPSPPDIPTGPQGMPAGPSLDTPDFGAPVPA